MFTKKFIISSIYFFVIFFKEIAELTALISFINQNTLLYSTALLILAEQIASYLRIITIILTNVYHKHKKNISIYIHHINMILN